MKALQVDSAGLDAVLGKTFGLIGTLWLGKTRCLIEPRIRFPPAKPPSVSLAVSRFCAVVFTTCDMNPQRNGKLHHAELKNIAPTLKYFCPREAQTDHS